jgi:hypothetical protein
LAVALENALEARRQRTIVSQSQVNVVKWSCLIVQAICSLLVIALVHSHDRMASTITMGLCRIARRIWHRRGLTMRSLIRT